LILKRAKVEAMKKDIEKLSIEKISMSGIQEQRDRGVLAIQAPIVAARC
jgi:hypothetical protein